MASQVAEYMQGWIQAGANRTQIREELLAVGWYEEEADTAYRDGLIALNIPLPSESGKAISGKSHLQPTLC